MKTWLERGRAEAPVPSPSCGADPAGVRLCRDLLESLQWQARFVANIEADARRTEDAASKAKQALWDERVRLLYSGEDRFPGPPPSPTGPLQHAGAPSPQSTQPQPGRLAKQQSWGKLARLISL